MPTIDEIFETMPAEASVNYEELTIDAESRLILVPDAEKLFGVESDTQAECKHFRCPRYVGAGLDLAGCFLRVNFRNANGEVDSYLVTDVAIDGEDITFSWELSKKVTAYKGEVQFVVCAVMGAGLPEWNTTLAVGEVLEGLEPDSSTVEAETADVIAQLLAMVAAQTSAVEAVGAAQCAEVKKVGEDTTEEAKAAVEAKGEAVVASIPADYTALSATVDRLTRDRAAAIVCEAEGESVQVADASADPLIGLRLFGKSTQDGTPTPEAPVEVVSAKAPVVTITDGTEENVQTLTLSTPDSLPGIPVTSGGNYTDANGQQWIADEVDLARGVYVRRIGSKVFDGSEDEKWIATNVIYHIAIPDKRSNYTAVPNALLCSHFAVPFAMDGYKTGCISETYYHSGNLNILVNYDEGEGGTDNFKAWLQSNPVTVYYLLATPIETPLSTEEIEAYKALLANKPTTTVLNDAGAWMALEYAADPKTYIDNKIAALLAANN